MPLWPNFIGPAYRARSESAAADTLKNLYLEMTEIAEETKSGFFYGTPGLKSLLSTSGSGCRGTWSQDGLTIAVIGGTVYQVDFLALTATSLGTMPNDGARCSFASNGRGGEQLGICGGGVLKVLDLVTMTLSGSVSLPLSNLPVVLKFIDGYGLLLEADTATVWFSNLEDLTTWDALDFFARSHSSDNLVGMEVVRNRLWTFGSDYTEVYYDTGDADNPFQPYPGSLMHEGAVYWAAIVGVGDAVYWLGQNRTGTNRVLRGVDYSPVVISSPAISFALAALSRDMAAAEADAYEQEGHDFVCWSIGDETWCYDIRESALTGEACWHQRTNWDETHGTEHRWRARGICAAGSVILCGDYLSGDLYTLDLDTFEDNGNTIVRERTAPYLSTENQWLFLDQIEMGLQSGVGLSSGQGSDPELLLSVSGNGGASFNPPIAGTMGAIGEALNRAMWVMLGRVRADRLVIRIRQSDPVRAAWGPGLWLRATPGSGRL